MWFKVISMENFDSVWGSINIGDELECTQAEDLNEFKKYIKKQYGPNGQNIKVKFEILKEE